MNTESKNIDIANINAMNDLPITARLEFVRNIIFDKGGDKHSIPQDPALITAKEVLDGVIKALRNNPTLSPRLGTPEP